MIISHLIIFMSLTVTCMVTTAFGAPSLTPQQVAERLQQRYTTTNSLKANFTQISYSGMSQRQKHGKGSLLFLKPGKVRWDYLKPDTQVIICDGKKIIMFFANDKQMLVSAAKEYLKADLAYSFFSGTGNIVRDFEIRTPTELDLRSSPTDEKVAIELTPKNNHPQIDHIIIWTDTQKFLIHRLMIIDTFGSMTDINFNNIIINEPVSKISFDFTPPPGTEIINQ